MFVIAFITGKGGGDRDRTVLTPGFVYQRRRRWGAEREVYIPLSHLSSIHFSYSAPVILLVLAVLAVLTGILAPRWQWLGQEDPKTALWAGIIAAILLIVLFFLGRRQSLTLASSSAKIRVQVRGANRQVMKDFVEEVQNQQAAFLRNLIRGEESGDAVTSPARPRGADLNF